MITFLKALSFQLTNWLTEYVDSFQFYDGPVNGSKKGLDAARGPYGSEGITGDVADTPSSKTNARFHLPLFISFFVPIFLRIAF